MTRLSSLTLLLAASLALSSPAFAKTTIAKGENLCKAEIAKVHAPKSQKVDKDQIKATTASFIYTVTVKSTEDVSSRIRCTVDRDSEAVSLASLG